MILVILGTQDKQFPRLLEAIDREINNGTIKDKVVIIQIPKIVNYGIIANIIFCESNFLGRVYIIAF